MSGTTKFGKRKKLSITLRDLPSDLRVARKMFQDGAFLESFDIYEQLVAAYPDHSIVLLAELYDLYNALPQKDRYHLYQARYLHFGIKSEDKVLDIGSGHIPFPLASHLSDVTFSGDSLGRAGAPFKYIQGKPVFECGVEDMPFGDKEFDFVYCSHVLEHTQDPEKACRELMRVARRGYIETPTKGKDTFLNSAKISNHVWGVESVNDRLIFTEYTPEQIEALQCDILMNMHCAPQTEREKAFSALIYLKADMVNTMFLWEGRFEIEVRRLNRELRSSSRQIPAAVRSFPPHVEDLGSKRARLISDIDDILMQPQRDFAPLLAIAGDLLEANCFQEATELCNLLIGQFGDNSEMYGILGRASSGIGRLTDALKQFRKAYSLNEMDRKAGLDLAEALEMTGNPDEARGVYRRLKACFPDDMEISEKIRELGKASGKKTPERAIEDVRISSSATRQPPSRKVQTSLKFVQVHTFYPEYLVGLYTSNPALAQAPFRKQVEALVEDGFSGIHMFAPYMHKFGYEPHLIIANNPHSQNQWLIENNVVLGESRDWLHEVTRKQLDAIRPDVLYLSDPITFDSKFIRTLSWKPALILGWRAANIPETTDWSEFDIMLSSLSALRDAAIKLGARNAEHFFPGFPTWIGDRIRDVRPEYDVVFSGLWTLGQHARRNMYLQEVARATSDKEKEYSCAFYLSGEVDNLPNEVAKYNLGGRFGIKMHRALRTGRIALDARGVLEIRDSAKQQVTDLARRETANMRIFEATGSGVFLLTEYHENLKEYFQPGLEIETFRDSKELIGKIRYYVAHPLEREAIAQRGHERCLREYSIENRAAEFDRIVRKYLLKKQSGQIAMRGHERFLREHTTEKKAQALDKMTHSHFAENASKPLETSNLTAVTRSLPSKTEISKEVLENSVATLMQRALQAFKGDRIDEAFETLSRAKSLRISVTGLDYLRALCFVRMERFEDAKQALLEELRYFPCNADAVRLIGQLNSQFPEPESPGIQDAEFQSLLRTVRPYTQLSVARLYTIFNHARSICQKNIPGNFVECGVAAGGSTAVLAYVAKNYSRQPRLVYAFDSFEGMPHPSIYDVHEGVSAQASGWGAGTCAAPEDSVKEICSKLGVMDRVTLFKGYFEDTLPMKRDFIGMISLLHLDGDWYESTRTILVNLYERVVNDGILQVDDYGYWEGCRRALQEFEQERNIHFEIKHIDTTGIWFVKPDRFPLNPDIPESLVLEFQKDDPVLRGVESQMSTNERFQVYYAVRRVLPKGTASLRFIEIGSYSGASLLLMYNAIRRDSRALQGFAVEPAGTPQFYQVIGNLGPHVSHLKMHSFEAAPLLREVFVRDGKLADVILVDGDHSYEGVRQDILLYYPLLAAGGIMIFHDHLPPLDEMNREAILYHHAGNEPGIRNACCELMETSHKCDVLDLPLLYPTDPTQTQAQLPIIPGVFSTVRIYRKPPVGHAEPLVNPD